MDCLYMVCLQKGKIMKLVIELVHYLFLSSNQGTEQHFCEQKKASFQDFSHLDVNQKRRREGKQQITD